MSRERDTPTDAVILPERCGLDAAQEIARAAPTEEGGRLVVDASAVARMSAPATLALASAAASLARRGGALVVRAPSAPFSAAFADLGLFEQLMKMEFSE